MKQHARKPLLPPRPLGRAKLELVRNTQTELTAQAEPFSRIAGDLPPLFERHWREMGEQDCPLDPDWSQMYVLEAQGQLRIVTARQGSVLVGYIFNVLGRHPHSRSTLFSRIDNLWLDPAYRGGWFVVRWLKANEAMLDELKIKKRYIGIPNHFMTGRVGNIFRRLGYKSYETVWTK